MEGKASVRSDNDPLVVFLVDVLVEPREGVEEPVYPVDCKVGESEVEDDREDHVTHSSILFRWIVVKFAVTSDGDHVERQREKAHHWNAEARGGHLLPYLVLQYPLVFQIVLVVKDEKVERANHKVHKVPSQSHYHVQ